jgi:hypothetical protein
MPSPPYPSPENNALLQVIVGNAIAAVEREEISWKDAVVHGWYEGHIEGEDTCPGCDYRGRLPKGSNRA